MLSFLWSLLNHSSIVIVSILLSILYLAIALSRVGYDARTIRRVIIPNAPNEVRKLLKTTTNNGDLIHVILLRSFHNNETLSQTDMTTYAQGKGVEITQPQIRQYILKMDKMGLINSPETRYETERKEYQLTEAGQWCRKCFPDRLFTFCVQNGLRLTRMKQYPGSVPAQPAEKPPESTQPQQLEHD